MPTETYKIWLNIEKCTEEGDDEHWEDVILPVSYPKTFTDMDKAVEFIANLTDLPVEEVALPPKDPLTVTIEVTGGVAFVTDKPAGIEVKIVDHDVDQEE